jgi:tRNA-Thr(GGU) m(6)t(6)A37 methyltransferase TsaA
MTQNDADIRPLEVAVKAPEPIGATLHFIGRIHTPWTDRKDCPRQGRHDGPDCHIEVFPPWDQGLKGLEAYDSIELLYWLDRSRRDLVIQNPGHTDNTTGTFALRSPVRPNPIGTSLVRLVRIDGNVLTVRGLDCLDGTPLVDIKPDRCAYSPKAPPKEQAKPAKT